MGVAHFGHCPIFWTKNTDAHNFGTWCRSKFKLGKLCCLDDISGLASSEFPISARKQGFGRRGNFGTDSSVGPKWRNLKPVSLQIWSVPMISGYLHLENRKILYGPNLDPFRVLTLFGAQKLHSL